MVVIREVAYAPPVHFEPCECFTVDLAAGMCSECGWLEEDH